MAISREDIELAYKILREWKSASFSKPQAKKKVEHLETVIKGLTNES